MGIASMILGGMCLAAAGLPSAQTPAKNGSASKQPAASAAQVEEGRKAYEAKCAVCHYEKSAAKKIGPGLLGLAKRGKYADGKPVDDASLRVWIEKGGKNMPGFKDSLKAEQVRDLIAYLKSL